jgi:hypothetical protein
MRNLGTLADKQFQSTSNPLDEIHLSFWRVIKQNYLQLHWSPK